MYYLNLRGIPLAAGCLVRNAIWGWRRVEEEREQRQGN